MFEGFANVWTPLVEVRRVARAPLRVMLAGEALVLFRHAEGVSALLDRCPHRGAALGRPPQGRLDDPDPAARGSQVIELPVLKPVVDGPPRHADQFGCLVDADHSRAFRRRFETRHSVTAPYLIAADPTASPDR